MGPRMGLWDHGAMGRGHGPQSLRVRSPGRARAQAGKQIMKNMLFKENWNPTKKKCLSHVCQFSSKCPNVIFLKTNPIRLNRLLDRSFRLNRLVRALPKIFGKK